MYLFLTAADSTGAAGGGASMILMFVVLIAVFYFFMIRPENKRKKEAQQMRDSLKVGDNITTIGGRAVSQEQSKSSYRSPRFEPVIIR